LAGSPEGDLQRHRDQQVLAAYKSVSLDVNTADSIPVRTLDMESVRMRDGEEAYM